MRKLIEKQQDSIIVCDNPQCDYETSYTSENGLLLFVGKPCPKCGENLLTVEDYLRSQRLMKVVNFINFWFSWITFFYSKKRLSKGISYCVDVHDGVKFSPLINCNHSVDGFAINDDDTNWRVFCPNCGRSIEYAGYFDSSEVTRCECGDRFTTRRVYFDNGSYIN